MIECICCKGKFDPKKNKVWYAHALYGADEVSAVVKCLMEGRIAPGKYTEQFEREVARIFGKDHAIMVNSGSSANIIATELLGLKPGDEVITTACSFPTTISSLVMKGVIPVVADSKVGTYNLDLDFLEQMLSEKTKAIMVADLCGSVNDHKRIREFCDKHGIKYVLDSCDTIGSRLYGRPTGEYADMVTTSFYASHVVTAGGGGGMLIVSSPEERRIGIAYRDWGRAEEFSFTGGVHEDESAERRFSYELDGVPYDSKFLYVYMGYNFKSTEMNAAFGLAQLPKLSQWNETRRKNFDTLTETIGKNWGQFLITPVVLDGAESSWLSYPLTIRDGSPFSRKELLIFLENHNIQTRLLMAGNLFKHQAYKDVPRRVVGELKGVDKIMRDSFVLGLHQQIDDDTMAYMLDTLDEFFRKYA